MKKKESLLFVEECFRNIQLEKDIDKNIRLIESTIKREYSIPINSLYRKYQSSISEL